MRILYSFKEVNILYSFKEVVLIFIWVSAKELRPDGGRPNGWALVVCQGRCCLILSWAQETRGCMELAAAFQGNAPLQRQGLVRGAARVLDGRAPLAGVEPPGDCRQGPVWEQ